MSYSGVGLQTPRGSGTSGHVQKSLVDKKRQGSREQRKRHEHDEKRRAARAKQVAARKAAGSEIKDHDRRRAISVKCSELRDKLEAQDIEDEEIARRVDELRLNLTNEIERDDTLNAASASDREDSPVTSAENVASAAVPEYRPRYANR